MYQGRDESMTDQDKAALKELEEKARQEEAQRREEASKAPGKLREFGTC